MLSQKHDAYLTPLRKRERSGSAHSPASFGTNAPRLSTANKVLQTGSASKLEDAGNDSSFANLG